MKAWFLTIMFLMPGAQDDEALILTLQAPSYALCIHFAGGWKHMSTRKMIRGDNMQEVITVLSTHCAERSTEVVKKAENLAELLELIERRKLNPHHTWRKRMDELDKRVSRE